MKPKPPTANSLASNPFDNLLNAAITLRQRLSVEPPKAKALKHKGLSREKRINSQADLDRWYDGTIQYTGSVCSISGSFSTATVDVTPLINAWNNYIAFLKTLPAPIEFPNTPSNRQKVATIRQKEQEIKGCLQSGDDRVYNNFLREVNSFETDGVDLEGARSGFETQPSQTNSLPRIQAALQKLLNQNKILQQFALVSSPRTDQAIQRVRALITRFQRVFFVDEIDRLRQEYITYSVRVPARGEFRNTLTGSSYTFAELNYGEYSYAILTGRMLAGLEKIKKALGARATITSCYRNPHKQVTQIGGSASSQHCYGTAVDLRTSNDQALWTRTGDAACKADADWVEPQAQSTLDHVHADWRGQKVGTSYCNRKVVARSRREAVLDTESYSDTC
jgi:Peptidase M15